MILIVVFILLILNNNFIMILIFLCINLGRFFIKKFLYFLFVGLKFLGIIYFCEIFKFFLSGNCIFIFCFFYDVKIFLFIDSLFNVLWIFFFIIVCW